MTITSKESPLENAIAIFFEFSQAADFGWQAFASPTGRATTTAAYNSSMEFTLTELEQAINYWRTLRPSRGEECALSPEVNTLAADYALMIFYRLTTIPTEQLNPGSQQLLQTWRAQV